MEKEEYVRLLQANSSRFTLTISVCLGLVQGWLVGACLGATKKGAIADPRVTRRVRCNLRGVTKRGGYCVN